MKRVDFFVPAYNQALLLEPFIVRLESVLRPLKQQFRVFCIDRSSQDETEAIVKKLELRHPIHYIKVRKNASLTDALKAALPYSGTPYIGIIELLSQPTLESLPTALRMTKMYAAVTVACPTIFSIISREIADHLPRTASSRSMFSSAVHDVAAGLGYRATELPPEAATETSSAGRMSVFHVLKHWAISLFDLKKLPTVEPHKKNSMAGAGVIHRSTRFVTHTTLSHSQSAVLTFTPVQRIFIASVFILLAATLILWPLPTVKIMIAVLSCIYFLDIFFNIGIIAKGMKDPPEIQFGTTELDSLDNSSLPVYSILCPLYHESAVLPGFVRAIAALDWPKDKLDVQLLLEENDTETIKTAQDLGLPPYIRITIVPHSQPKTKPKACNWGLAHARGEYLVIYDAEDIPDPLQLKKAYLAFNKLPENVRCLQAKLNYFNPHQNLLTRLFSIEYSLWFDVTLPGLQTLDTLIPLGGTSNHFRRADLLELKGWDPFNVTEDADLGVRLFKKGYRTAIIDSVTLEEANSNIGNWLRQRSRWIKGYMQTFLVHMRDPGAFAAEHGWHAFYFQMIVGGKLAFMLINPLMWLLTLSYFLLRPIVGDAIESLYPGVVFGMAFTSLIFGNFLFVYCYMIGAAKREEWWLMKYVFLQPFYWLFVSAAATVALFQLFIKPHYWEKTQHGLHLGASARKVSQTEYPQLTVPAVNKRRRSRRILSPLAGGGVYIVVTLISSICSFAYTLYLGKSLPLPVFGLVALMGALILVAQISFTALTRSVSYESASAVRAADILPLVSRVRRQALWWGSAAMIAGYLFMYPAVNFFGSQTALTYFLFVPILLCGSLYAVEAGILAGTRRYAHLAAASLVETAVKISVGIAGLITGSAPLLFAAFPLSTLAGYISSRSSTGLRTRTPVESTRPIRRPAADTKTFYWYSLLNRATAYVFMSVDVVLAIRYLPADMAGSYALLSTIGKIIFFAGSLFTPFITPEIARESRTRSMQPPYARLSILLSIASSSAAFYLFGLLSEHTLPLMYGERAQTLIPYAVFYAAGAACFSVASAVSTYFLAKKKYVFTVFSAVLVVWQTISFIVWHDSIATFTSVIFVSGVAQVGMVISLYVLRPLIQYLTDFTVDLFSLFTHLPRVAAPPHKLKILIFNWRDTGHSFAGGAEVYVHELSRHWVKHGHAVTQFSGNDGTHSREQLVDGIQLIRRGGTYTVYFWAALYYIFRLRGKYDVIIDCENGIPFFTPLYAWGIPKFLLVFHVHQNIFRSYLPLPARILASFLERTVTPLVYSREKVITISPSSRQELLSVGMARDGMVQIIEPGVRHIYSSAAKTEHPSFLYLGRLKRYKNIDIAVQAFARVVQSHPSARLTIAGSGEMHRMLKQLTENLHIQDKVTFQGHVTESLKHKLLTESWAAIQPSSYEGWGLTVIEANAAGTPVIASNVPGLKDSVVPNKTGILVAKGSAAALASAMEQIVTDRSTRESLSKQAREWASTFSWDLSAKKFIESAYAAVREQRVASL